MNYRNAIFGFSAIWIVFYHIYSVYRLPNIPIVSQIINMGNMGVDIFVFLSAVGLSFSIEKNSLKEFYYNRVKRVLLPFLLISVPFYVWDALAVYGVNIKALSEFLLNITTLSFWCRKGAPAWYMSFVLVTYAIFPLLYKLKKKHKWTLVLLIALSIITEIFLKFIESPIYTFGERVLSRIPIFLIGMIVADFVKENRKINKLFSFSTISIACAGAICIVLSNPDIVIVRYIYAFMSISIILVLSFILDKIQNISTLKPLVGILNFCGSNSLEIYLIHTFIIRFLSYYNLLHMTHYMVYYVTIFGASIMISSGIKILASYITKPRKNIENSCA